ncbi:MAG: SagB/ThcOx family dehydrogenase [Alphaproteobacteria bacterium]|nr:SagB/ThcOx family dehydrogenase [Alphaproteobacteria bacterium]
MSKFLILFLAFFSVSTALAEDTSVNLPQPDLSIKTPLMQALAKRKSTKKYGSRGITEQSLGNLLWAASGQNRDNGGLTIPTSMNSQDLDIYVLKADGTWLYIPKYHRLKKISDKDLRFLTAKQDYVLDAAMVLIYVSGQEDMTAGMHAGSAYQNVGLYAAATGMGTVVRAFFDKDDMARELKLPAHKKVVVSQVLGWPRN